MFLNLCITVRLLKYFILGDIPLKKRVMDNIQFYITYLDLFNVTYTHLDLLQHTG